MKLHRTLKVFGKEENDYEASLEVPKEFIEPDKEAVRIVLDSLKENNTSITLLIEGKIKLEAAEQEDNQYEVIMLPELLALLQPICNSKFDNPEILENLLKSLVAKDQDYIMVKRLMEVFDEEHLKEDDLLKDIDELNNESLEIIRNIVKYLEGNKLTAIDFLSEIIFQQEMLIEDEKVTIDAIESKKFYKLLKNSQITGEEEEKLNNFLSLNKELQDLFAAKKLLSLIEHIKSSQEENIE